MNAGLGSVQARPSQFNLSKLAGKLASGHKGENWCGTISPLNGMSHLSGRASDRGGDRLSTARSLRPYLQGLAVPGTHRSLRDATGQKDPDFYRLFDQRSASTFQGNGGLLISCNLRNLSDAPISIALLNKQGKVINGSLKTVQAGQDFVYDQTLSRDTFYVKVTSRSPGQHRYDLNLPIINS